ncbi:hypothetical protein FB451DRAFT_1232812 [Mycena latifolia]|nr:hypothetical protein FB451DRAFT_1232812 [Mycena latifolia]
MFPLAWGNMTEFDFSGVWISVYDIAYILPNCTGLVRFDFWTDCSNGCFMPKIAPVTIPKLESINWQGIHVDDTSIFSPLILPGLRSLDLRNGVEDTVFLLHTHSSFALHSLILTFFGISFTHFSTFLRKMPSLTTLELYQSLTITDALLEFLTFDARRPVLPRLERLIMCCPEQHFSEVVLLRMVESRWGAARTPLKHVRIDAKSVPVHASTPAVHRRVLARIAALVAKGMHFDYKN